MPFLFSDIHILHLLQATTKQSNGSSHSITCILSKCIVIDVQSIFNVQGIKYSESKEMEEPNVCISTTPDDLIKPIYT